MCWCRHRQTGASLHILLFVPCSRDARSVCNAIHACRYSSAAACSTCAHFVYGAYSYVVVAELASKRVVAVLQGHGHKVTSVAAAPDVEVVISGSKDRSVAAWNLEQCSVLRKRTKLPAEVAALGMLTTPPTTAVIALSNGQLLGWNWAEGAALQVLSLLL